MKILNLSDITGAVSMPLKKGTLQFLQDSYGELFKATIIALIGPSYNPGTVYVLYGCVNSGTYIISEGAVFYNGEIYLVDATSFSVTGTDTAIFAVETTQYTTNADPVTFTDSTTHNVHNIRKMDIIAGASGSGSIADYSQAFFMSFVIPAQVHLSGAGVTGSYPNYTIPGLANSYPIIYGGSYAIGDLQNPGLDYNITFPSVGTSSYFVNGTIISNGTPELDALAIWTIRGRSATGFILHVREMIHDTLQNIAFEYTLVLKPV
jgi:hypothetical protein